MQFNSVIILLTFRIEPGSVLSSVIADVVLAKIQSLCPTQLLISCFGKYKTQLVLTLFNFRNSFSKIFPMGDIAHIAFFW